MTVQSIRGVVEAAIQRASSATGVDFGFLMRAAQRESGYNPGAHAKTSSAAGLFQFVDQTWLSTLKQHGAKYGYSRYADLIQKGPSGHYYVAGADRQTVMDLRLDPDASSFMAGELASDHAAYLRGRVGREPTSGELYVAHVLGPQGSAKLIEAVRVSPSASAPALFPDAANANRPIFYKGGRPASVAEVYANLTSLPGGSSPATKPVKPLEPSFIEFASARRTEQLQQEEALVAVLLKGSSDDPGGGIGAQLAGGLFSTEMLQAMAEQSDKISKS